MAQLLACKSVSREYRALSNKYLVRSVKREHPILFCGALMAARMFRSREGRFPSGLPFTEADVSYVTMLLANEGLDAPRPVRVLLVTSFEEDIASYLRGKLESGVPGVAVARLADIGEDWRSVAPGYDLAVSTVLVDAPGVVKVSRRMDDGDLAAVAAAAEEARRARLRVVPRRGALFAKPLVSLGCRAKRKETALEQGCSVLYERGFVDEGFYDACLRGERVTGSAVGRGVAVPCVVDESVRRSAVVAMRLRRPVYWGGGEQVDVVFLFAVTTRRGRRPASVAVEMRALMGTGVVERLREAGDERSVRALLRDAPIFQD